MSAWNHPKDYVLIPKPSLRISRLFSILKSNINTNIGSLKTVEYCVYTFQKFKGQFCTYTVHCLMQETCRLLKENIYVDYFMSHIFAHLIYLTRKRHSSSKTHEYSLKEAPNSIKCHFLQFFFKENASSMEWHSKGQN